MLADGIKSYEGAVSTLSMILTLQLLSTSVLAAPKQDKPKKEKNNKAEVIAIVDGVDINKDDIDKNRLINEEVFLKKII